MSISMYMCGCKDCHKMRKAGRVLGVRVARHFRDGWTPDGMHGPYSDYVPHPKFSPGRKRVNRSKENRDKIFQSITD